jgi:hypothetical protein
MKIYNKEIIKSDIQFALENGRFNLFRYVKSLET